MKLAFALAFACILGCPAFAGDLPDHHLTPGVTNPAITQANVAKTICVANYTARPGIRHVTPAMKKQAFAAYHVNPKLGGPYEIDHLISLEIGGANDPKNLWPESYSTKPLNAHVKDALENRLHKLVCNGTITLKTAQDAISSDWIAAYRKYIGQLSQ